MEIGRPDSVSQDVVLGTQATVGIPTAKGLNPRRVGSVGHEVLINAGGSQELTHMSAHVCLQGIVGAVSLLPPASSSALSLVNSHLEPCVGEVLEMHFWLLFFDAGQVSRGGGGDVCLRITPPCPGTSCDTVILPVLFAVPAPTFPLSPWGTGEIGKLFSWESFGTV